MVSFKLKQCPYVMINLLYFSDMYLNKSPFVDTDDGDLYISMNVRL